MADEEYTKADYYRALRKKRLFISVCVILIVIAFGISLTVGFYDIGFVETYKVIIDHLAGNIADVSDDNIIWDQTADLAVRNSLWRGAGGWRGGHAVCSPQSSRRPLYDGHLIGCIPWSGSVNHPGAVPGSGAERERLAHRNGIRVRADPCGHNSGDVSQA